MTFAQVDDAVDRLLTPAETEAFRACRAPGHMPVREFARTTDRSPGTVGNLLRRADDKLTDALGDFALPLDFLTERDDQTGSWRRAVEEGDAAELERLNRYGWRVQLPDGSPHLTALGTEREAYVGWCDCKGFKHNDGPCAHLCTLRQAAFIDARDVDGEPVDIPDTEGEKKALPDGGAFVEDYAAGADGEVFGRPEGRL
jgi:hypothetical protein